MSDASGTYSVDGFLTAAALVAMAARFSAGRPGADQIACEADDLRTGVISLADTDAVAYGAVLAAYRSPTADPGRRERIRAALRHAADVPRQIAATRTCSATRTPRSWSQRKRRGRQRTWSGSTSSSVGWMPR